MCNAHDLEWWSGELLGKSKALHEVQGIEAQMAALWDFHEHCDRLAREALAMSQQVMGAFAAQFG